MSSDDERIGVRAPTRVSRSRRDNAMASQRDQMSQSMHLPGRFEADDDGLPDVSSCGTNMPYNMSQSFFQMLTSASSKTRVGPRFDAADSEDDVDDDTAAMGGHRARLGSKLSSRLQSIEERSLREAGDSDDEGRGPAPVMSQMLEAQAQLNSLTLAERILEQQEEDMLGSDISPPKELTDQTEELAQKLKDIFKLPEIEQVVSEYPCWLLKSVLLQGYMYITKRHICFYAYLPRKTDITTKSGYLNKRGKSTVKYNRYWFILKGDVLSYFADPSDLYFPNGQIDLRYGISTTLEQTNDKTKETTGFVVTTDERKLHFRADSAASAKEWVKALQKVIFRTHNEGDSVKISIPTANIMEIEESPALEFADTIKLKVVDNDDTFAIDEYFFSFFSFGNDALRVLQRVIDESPEPKAAEATMEQSVISSSSQYYPAPTTLHEPVRATLSTSVGATSARGSPRASVEISRTSFDIGRRSADVSRENLKRSTDPTRHSMDTSRSSSIPPYTTEPSFGESSDAVRLSSDDESNLSASNILNRSDLFRSPSMKKHVRRSLSLRKRNREKSSSPAESVLTASPPPRNAKITRPQRPTHPLEGENQPQMQSQSKAGPSLQEIKRMGTFPLQRAAGWADWMKRRGQKVGSFLSSEPMGYIEKVSDMWTGGRKHYKGPMGMMPHEQLDAGEQEEEDDDADNAQERFRHRFALSSQDRLTAVYFGYLNRVLPYYGKLYLGNRHLCFRSIIPTAKTKMILPLKVVENVLKEKGFRFGYSALVITVRGHEELFFEFGQADTRDDFALTLMQNIDDLRLLESSGILSKEEKDEAERAKKEHQSLQDARQLGHNPLNTQLSTKCDSSMSGSVPPPIIFDDPQGSILNFKPTEPMNITCLTIGSRGDVQPYIALCLGLMKDGHRCKIATHAEFKDWVEEWGIEFAPVEGDPAELMAICVDYGMFTLEFMKQANTKMRGWLDGLLESSWHACQSADLLIESPSAMGGIHIAEALGIPYFRAFSMPWTRTRAYPHAFAVPEYKLGGAYNYYSYVIIETVFWKSIAGQVNRWRKRLLNLRSTNLDKLQQNKVPFLYNFSPSVVAPPLDYSDWIRVTGYWFLDSKSDFTPPADLVDFIRSARRDEKRIIYIGFGSVTVGDSVAMTKSVVESVLKAGVRCILSKGWSDRLTKHIAGKVEIPLPSDIFQINSCPHDWLFTQVDAACHHGGAGTTGASLRAGLPTIIRPFFGDQFYWGNRVEDSGVGICLRKLNTPALSKAIWEVTHDERMIKMASVLGEHIRSENGVDVAISCIYRDLEYARTLVKQPREEGEESEESWTIVGEEEEAR